MTVIAYDGTFLAADRKCSHGDRGEAVTKLKEISPRCCAAFYGDGTQGDKLMAWAAAGFLTAQFPPTPANEDDLAVMIVGDADGVRLYYSDSHIPRWLEQSSYAWGSGGLMAHGAILAGATAMQAVAIANEHINTCGFGCDFIDLRKYAKPTKRKAK